MSGAFDDLDSNALSSNPASEIAARVEREITMAHVETFARLAGMSHHVEEQREWETLPAALRAMDPGTALGGYQSDCVREIAAGLRMVVCERETARDNAILWSDACAAATAEVADRDETIASLRATIAEHEKAREQIRAVIAADNWPTGTEMGHSMAPLPGLVQTVVQHGRRMEQERDDLRTRLAPLTAIIMDLRPLTGATADADVVGLVRAIIAQNEGQRTAIRAHEERERTLVTRIDALQSTTMTEALALLRAQADAANRSEPEEMVRLRGEMDTLAAENNDLRRRLGQAVGAQNTLALAVTEGGVERDRLRGDLDRLRAQAAARPVESELEQKAWELYRRGGIDRDTARAKAELWIADRNARREQSR